MKFVLIVLACLISSSAFAADKAAQIEGGTLVLHDTACTNPEVLKNILPEYHKDFKAGTGVITDPEARKRFGADTAPFCWLDEDSFILVVNRVGGAAMLDPDMFKPNGTGV